ncbi:hypothetical protein M0805_007619 [Coniferiporia weirii]|nr:hypothetical protein M0805_007619 [Coniferiporia weirii]
MPRLKNHEVWIESDGERYVEYETKVEGDVVTCYIASQIDKLFQIKWADRNVPILVSSAVWFDVDGVRLDGQANLDGSKRQTITSRGYRSDSTSFLPYKFSHIALTDDDAAFAPSNNMGTIRVNVYRVVIGEPADAVFLTLPDGFQKPLSERTKKMGSHRIGFGNVEKVTVPQRYRRTIPYQNEVGPYVSFKFLYRPKDVLQALEIIPATPAAIDLSDEDEKEQELLRRQAELARKIKELKERRKSSRTKVKMETKAEDCSNVSLKTTNFTYKDDGAIDLTLD